MSDQITHFRRFHHYDYNRGAVEFVTFHLEERKPLFGFITPDYLMHLSDAGKILDEVIQYESRRPVPIHLMRYCIMPEHLHMRLYIQPNTIEPLKRLGQFVSNVKRWSFKKCQEIGLRLSWQKNYHDRLCISREIIDRVDEYIDLNPMKWVLMHGANPPMKVIEPLCSSLLPANEWWTGVGNEQLLNGNIPLLSIRLSRQLPPTDAAGIISALIEECQKGYIPISTFISPMEIELFRRLSKTNIPMICVIPDCLKTIYRPKVEQTPLFANNRLLLLSHQQDGNISREHAWHSINEDIAQIAKTSYGKSIYLR